MRERPVGQIAAVFLSVLLLFGDCSLAAQEVFEVWSPGRSRSYYRDKMTVPFLEKIQELTGFKVSVNSSSDPKELIQACADYRAHHVLVNHIEGELLMRRFGYELIAYGDASTALYTRVSQNIPVNHLKSIGFLRRTGMDKAIVQELNITGLENRLVEFPSDAAGIKALFTDKIEGLIIGQHLIKQLSPNLREKLVQRYALRTPGRVMVLVSPRLEPDLRDRLQQFYLSDDPVIDDLFRRRAGLAVHPPEDLEKVLVQGGQLSAQ